MDTYVDYQAIVLLLNTKHIRPVNDMIDLILTSVLSCFKAINFPSCKDGAEMAQIKVRAAEDYVIRKAVPIDLLEFKFLYLGEETKGTILDWYREHQNLDGGFPALTERVGFSTENCSCLTMTLRNLRNLLLLGFHEEDVAEQALSFLFAHQEEDGSFREISAVSSYDIPEWSMPGDDDVALWQTTAALCYALQTKFEDAGEVSRGFEFLHNKWTLTDGLVSRFYFPQIYGLGAFGLWESVDDERFQKCVSNIVKVWGRLPLWEMPLILELCRAVGLDAEHPLAQKAISRLKVSQNPLGYWIDGFTQAGSSANTIFALLALKSYEVI